MEILFDSQRSRNLCRKLHNLEWIQTKVSLFYYKAYFRSVDDGAAGDQLVTDYEFHFGKFKNQNSGLQQAHRPTPPLYELLNIKLIKVTMNSILIFTFDPIIHQIIPTK